MSKYTTGEIAKLCGVSVRTVQYYDDRGILIPSELSEGGRRLYTEDDLKRMHIICFLREAGIPINGILQLFSEDKPESIISILLEQQEKILQDELASCKKRLDLISGIKSELKEIDSFSLESIGDIAYVMKQKNKLKKMRLGMILAGIPLGAFQIASVVLWVTHGYWWLFAAWAAVATIYGITFSAYYFSHVKYICPECHEVFKPRFKEAFWAYHTPNMRRLTCPKCGRRGLCVEVFAEMGDKK